VFLPLIEIPKPAYDDGDAPLPDSELVALPAPSGRAVTLQFASPWEAYLCLDGRRVVEHAAHDERRLLEWLHRRLPALHRALDLERGLRATLTDDGVCALDVVDLDSGEFLDHVRVRQTLGGAGVQLPGFAILGAVATKAELRDRLRGMYASGAALELRAEEAGRTVSRRHFRLGRE
jgi:hypothetical protein